MSKSNFSLLFAPALLLVACQEEDRADDSVPASVVETVSNSDQSEPPTLDIEDTDALIARIEELIELPDPEGRPLISYMRTYGPESFDANESDPDIVHGLLDRISSGTGGARWRNDPLAAPSDGGCDVITLRYSISQDQIIEQRCNGEA